MDVSESRGGETRSARTRAEMESLVHYSSPGHAISILGVLNEQRLRGHLCDVVLVVGENRYQAHRSILAASSEYFQSLFSRRDSENRAVIHLDFCEPDAFEIVLNYIYSSSLFVDKCSLAVVQELGYSLGIPFLTNIMSTRPQVSYCVSRKRLSFSEEDDGVYPNRSVIVRQSGMGATHRGTFSNLQGKAPKHTDTTSNETPPAQAFREQTHLSSGYVEPNEMGTNVPPVSTIANAQSEDGDSKPIISSLPSILKGHEYRSPSGRPQLTSSVSFSESVQLAGLHSDHTDDKTGVEKVEPMYDSKPVSGSQHGLHNQTIDRSGPLIKSLLRRSLSMDSPVPVFSPVLELKDSQSREQSVVKLAMTKTSGSPSPESKHQVSKHMPPLILRSKQHNALDKEGTQGAEVQVKTEPSSPLADPSEIIRITVGDNLPVSFKDFQTNFDEGPRYFSPSKRKMKLDGTSNPCKRSRVLNEHQFMHDDGTSGETPHNSNVDESNQEPGELRPSKMFKCWSCLKVFRSNAGLYRHVNMYHNPEKPYACDICHKRFHTNFKVWTHCQTQHGVVQNPAPSSSSYSVLDEKFQRKLIDIVREREIKKALIMKLRRNKQGLQAQPFAKKNRRSRSYGCPYCGKMFFFQSHFKLHMKVHTAERASIDAQDDDDLHERQDQAGHVKENQNKDVFPCRLCNQKLLSLAELEDHERACRYATVCPYCGLRFSNTLVKKDHEAHCKYKKLTCLECMRTFKSSFSIWRHQVEVHNQNMMNVREQLTQGHQDVNREAGDALRSIPPPSKESMARADLNREEAAYSDSSAPATFDSEDSSSYVPEDLSTGPSELRVKEEPQEAAVTDGEQTTAKPAPLEEAGVWPCEKCGKLFSSHKDLERHQELLCHIKPFICHICHKAFRTNFRLWSHYQSHMSSSEESGTRQVDRQPSSPSTPSPPLTIAIQDPPASRASPPKVTQAAVTSSEEESRRSKSPVSKPNRLEQEKSENGSGQHALGRSDSMDKPVASQESDTLFYHAPTLSALTFKRQYMCKLCHRTFKTAFSLWSHEQSHSHL
ncbi:zinc finger and BTB domain-containing protein 21 [Pygocentrus nattereri]|uniref:Zinc finger and BTB domain containing 21 n=1 Tax=Pygocentrus nattereri TaxID=42514 RepID=A0A3B4E0T9_PYGNA|nr:zinc finger and BTB domain-containing protein 21 [Pygocentrus nattereri]